MNNRLFKVMIREKVLAETYHFAARDMQKLMRHLQETWPDAEQECRIDSIEDLGEVKLL